MSYKWEAMVEDLTVERDRLLKENERLRKALALVAKLNPDFAGIGAGMIRTIVSEANSALKE